MHANKLVYRGFTLIETIIYISLFSIIMTGAVVSVYSLISSSTRNATKAMVAQEGAFLLGKIDWVLSDIESINLPTTSGNTLSVTKINGGIENPTIIKVSAGIMSIKKGVGQALSLNNSNTTVICPDSKCFTYELGSSTGINPESLSAYFTIQTKTPDGQVYSQNFYTIKYLRK